MIELIVLDLAGTTVEDPDGVGRAFKSALTAAGVPWTHESVNAIMGIPKPVAIAQLIGETAKPEWVQSIFLDFRSRMIEYYRTDPEVKAIKGAEDFFRTVRQRGIKVALDTGFDRLVVDALFARLGWDESIVDASVTSDEVTRGRPFPDLLFEAMARTGKTNVLKVAKVGDTPSDLAEGTAAGCGLVIGVTHGTHTREQLSACPHTHIVDSLEEILPLL